MIKGQRCLQGLQRTLLGALLALALGLPVACADQPGAAAAPQHGGGGFALLLLDYRMALERLTEDLRERAAELTAGADMVPTEIRDALYRVTAGADPAFLVAGLLGVLGLGLLARRAIRRRLTGELSEISLDQGTHFGNRLGRGLYRALVDLLGLGGFALVAIGLVAIFVPAPRPVRTFMLTYVTAALVTLAAALVARFLLAPDAPGARLLPLSDRTARFLNRWLMMLAAIGSVGWLTAALLILSGMQLEAHLILALAIGALMAVLLSAMILAGRPLVAAALVGDDPTTAGPVRLRWRARGMSLPSRIWSWCGRCGRRAS